MVPGSALRSAVTFLAMQGFQECWWEGMGHNRKGKGLQERVKCEVESWRATAWSGGCWEVSRRSWVWGFLCSFVFWYCSSYLLVEAQCRRLPPEGRNRRWLVGDELTAMKPRFRLVQNSRVVNSRRLHLSLWYVLWACEKESCVTAGQGACPCHPQEIEEEISSYKVRGFVVPYLSCLIITPPREMEQVDKGPLISISGQALW